MSFLPGTVLGFAAFKYITDDRKHRLAKNLPKVKVWKLQVSPNIRIISRRYVIHFHHWIFLSLAMAMTFFTSFSVLDHLFTRGLMVGGIIQGLSFPDWRKIIQTNSTSIWSTTRVDKETD